MKVSTIVLLAAVGSASAFSPTNRLTARPASLALNGYLDDLTQELHAPEEDWEEDDSREGTKLDKSQVANAGVGSWDTYVEFDSFDGGDGQMGVAGDGNKKLESFDMSQMAKSKQMSAKNAWGSNTGYADELRSKGVDTARAQQLENWNNQQELKSQRDHQKFMTESFDETTGEDEDWRALSKFGVERNQDFDMDETLGGVAAGDVDGVIELSAGMNGAAAVHEFPLRNEYMGFADFRAAFTSDTGVGWTIDPAEGSLMQREDTTFILRYKPQGPGMSEGYLVIETEDFKKTYKLVGTSA